MQSGGWQARPFADREQAAGIGPGDGLRAARTEGMGSAEGADGTEPDGTGLAAEANTSGIGGAQAGAVVQGGSGGFCSFLRESFDCTCRTGWAYISTFSYSSSL